MFFKMEFCEERNKIRFIDFYRFYAMVEAICSRVAIIDNGKVIAEGTKEELKESFSEFNKLILIINNEKEINIDSLKSINGIKKVDIKHNVLEITNSLKADNLDKILLEIINQNISIKSIEKTTVDLETVFLNLTGKKLRD